MKRILRLAPFLPLLFLAPVAGQQRDPAPNAGDSQVTFRAEANYVEVDVQVINAQGEPVEGLSKEDFEVIEAGKTQQISVFSTVQIPLPAASATPAIAAPEPDVRTNRLPFEGRLYVIVLDDLSTNIQRTARVKQAARRFLEQYFAASDLGAVVYTSGRSEASQELTSSRRLLLASVDKFLGKKLRSRTLERIDEYYRDQTGRDPEAEAQRTGNPVRDPLDFERAQQARSALATLKNVADWFGNVRGRRKAVLFISEGLDYNIFNVFDGRHSGAILDDAREAIAAATRANVNIYSIDPRGLSFLGEEQMDLTGLPNDAAQDLGVGSMLRDSQMAQDSLRVLADETGGFAAINSNDFKPAFDRIVRENSSYYILGYQPTNDRRDGKFRKIEVRMKRPGLQVRARKGYVAPRGKVPETPVAAGAGTSPALMELLNSPLPSAGLALEVTAAPFKGTTGASVLVTTQVDGARLRFVEKGGMFTDNLELSWMAVGENGKVVAAHRSAVDLQLKPETYQAVAANGFRMLSRVEVPAGRYQLRVAARETGGGAAGSVHYDLVVPDFSQPLAVSGLVITSTAAGRIPTAQPDPQLTDILPASPVSDRTFRRADTLAVLAEIYDNRSGPPAMLDISLTVVDAKGSIVHREVDELAGAGASNERRALGHLTEMPLRDLAPGPHVLTLEVRSRANRDAVVTREVPFVVLP